MIVYFQKIVTWFFSPIGILFFLVILLCLKFNKRNLILLIIFIFLSTNVPLAHYLFKKLESIDGDNKEINYDRIDYIIVLGGGKTKLVKDTNNKHYLIDYSGRYIEGIRIFNNLDFKKIVISNLELPWATSLNNQITDLLKYFKFVGIKKSEILVLDKPLNTLDEATKLFKIIGKQKIIVVTSAHHAARSKIIFEKKGFDVQIYKVDYLTTNDKLHNNLLNFLPNISATSMFSLMFKEILGVIYYGVLK
jgi:uncharacterized SAM-binding protein YcdF (DUF218 family)